MKREKQCKDCIEKIMRNWPLKNKALVYCDACMAEYREREKKESRNWYIMVRNKHAVDPCTGTPIPNKESIKFQRLVKAAKYRLDRLNLTNSNS